MRKTFIRSVHGTRGSGTRLPDGPISELVIREGRIVVLEVPARSISALTNFKSRHEDPARK